MHTSLEKGTDKEYWRGRPAEYRQRYMAETLFIPHPAFTSAIKEIDRLARRCSNESKGKAVLVLAGSGAGKTYLSRAIHKMKPEDHSGEVSRVPVVVFSIPSSPTQRALGSALLCALKDPKYKSGSAQDLFERAIHSLREIRTEIIFIDNVHDIPERRRSSGIMQLGNWIRDLIDRSHCLVVLLGTPAAKQVIDANAQLRRRVMTLKKMDYFAIDSPKAKGRFYRFLSELDKRMPLAERSSIYEPSIAHKIFYATYGVMDYIIQLMTEAIAFAVAGAREEIVLSDLEMAFERVFGDFSASCNTFSVSGPERPLDQEGEPFHNWFDNSNPQLRLQSDANAGGAK